MSLSVRHLDVTLQGTPVLRDVSFDEPDGALVSLLGASGAGKSTTLKVIAGILAPDSGEVTIDGHAVTAVPAHRRGTAVVFQDIRLFPHMTIEENVAYPLKVQGVRRAERIARAREFLAFMHLDGLGGRRTDECRAGQQQAPRSPGPIASQPRVLCSMSHSPGSMRACATRCATALMDVHRTLGITTLL
jgi:ABC-type Fe3+/spermidine/putrescine transport system ATPase subunit